MARANFRRLRRSMGRKLLATFITCSMFMAGCNVTVGVVPSNPPTAASPYDSKLENDFVELIGPDIQLNAGISVVRVSDGVSLLNLHEEPPAVSILVHNHSNEVVNFPDQAFDLEVYHVDAEGQWRQLKLMVNPAAIVKNIPPGLDRYDPAAGNMWSLFWNDLPVPVPPTIRLFIRGTGSESGTVYGAYLDVETVPAAP